MDSETRAGREGSATIFLVEDDPGVAMTLTDVLESEGYSVVHAATGAAAKASIDEAQPDLIILDLMLPDTDGLVLCADLKTRTGAPVIICSATNRKRDAVLGFKLGADDFNAKPFHIDELLPRAQAALRRARAAPHPPRCSPPKRRPCPTASRAATASATSASTTRGATSSWAT
jgi:DNA-binding response OmpR family regulator